MTTHCRLYSHWLVATLMLAASLHCGVLTAYGSLGNRGTVGSTERRSFQHDCCVDGGSQSGTGSASDHSSNRNQHHRSTDHQSSGHHSSGAKQPCCGPSIIANESSQLLRTISLLPDTSPFRAGDLIGSSWLSERQRAHAKMIDPLITTIVQLGTNSISELVRDLCLAPNAPPSTLL